MLHIKEVIVVEGRYDKNTLRQCVDAVILETGGFGIFSDREKMALLRRCAHPEWVSAAMFPISYGIYRLSILVHLNYTEDFVCRIPAFALGMLMGRYLTEERPFRPLHAAVWAGGSVCGAVVTVLRLLNKLYISPCYLIGAQLVPGCLLAGILLHRLLARLRSRISPPASIQPPEPAGRR